MATQLNKDYKINFTTYNKYLQDYETYAKDIFKYMNSIYTELCFLVNPNYWYDDNSFRVHEWYQKNYNSADSYESAYKTILEVLRISGLELSKRIKTSQETTYSKYAYIKKYANSADIYAALGSSSYRTTQVKALFSMPLPGPDRYGVNKANANLKYNKIVSLCKKLDEESNALAKRVLRYSSKLEGAYNDKEPVFASHARLIMRMSLFSKELKKQIEAGMEKSNLM